MKKVLSIFCLFGFGFLMAFGIRAQTVVSKGMVIVPEASESAEASTSGIILEDRTVKDDLTESKEAKSRLERVLEGKEVGKLSWNNFLQVAIRRAVDNGVPVNVVVLMILFPLVAALIAAARHVVGLQGFGIFTPAVISVAFLATGITMGLLLFLGIMVMATLARMFLRRLRLPSMPRMAMLLWFVSMGVLGLILVSPSLKLSSLVDINIFPILLLILLAETFIEVQITTTVRNAVGQTFQTLVLALVSYLVMSTQVLQEWVLLNPEIAALLVFVLDIFIGRYEGLRLLERWRFRKLLND